MASEAHAHRQETLALREQFETASQQKDASTLGMWIFLITEVMFFGGMFLAYTVYRWSYPEIFAVASTSINVYWGAANTVVLLCSSLTMLPTNPEQVDGADPTTPPVIGHLVSAQFHLIS